MKPQDFAALAATMADEHANQIDYLTIEHNEDDHTTRLEITFREKPKPIRLVDHAFHTSRGGLL